jgi:hypothetical protein
MEPRRGWEQGFLPRLLEACTAPLTPVASFQMRLMAGGLLHQMREASTAPLPPVESVKVNLVTGDPPQCTGPLPPLVRGGRLHQVRKPLPLQLLEIMIMEVAICTFQALMQQVPPFLPQVPYPLRSARPASRRIQHLI